MREKVLPQVEGGFPGAEAGGAGGGDEVAGFQEGDVGGFVSENRQCLVMSTAGAEKRQVVSDVALLLRGIGLGG